MEESEISFVKNAEKPIWVAFETARGRQLGHIELTESGYQVYVWSPIVQSDIPQGSPHKTLDLAKSDLHWFYN